MGRRAELNKYLLVLEKEKPVLNSVIDYGESWAVPLLLNEGADPNHTDNQDLTPAHWASIMGETDILKVLLEHAERLGTEDLEKMLKAKDNKGNTPLHAAAFLGRIEIVALLIKHKANVNTKNDDGETPLESVTSDWTEALQKGTQFTANVLKIKVDMGELKAARPGIAEMLRKHGGKTAKPSI